MGMRLFGFSLSDIPSVTQINRQCSAALLSMMPFFLPQKDQGVRIREKKDKVLWLVTGRQEVIAVSQPVNSFLNPINMHFKHMPLTTYNQKHTHAHHSSLKSLNPETRSLHILINKFNFSWSALTLSTSVTPPALSLLHPVRREPQAAVWEYRETALKFLKQRLWQNQTISLPEANRLT